MVHREHVVPIVMVIQQKCVAHTIHTPCITLMDVRVTINIKFVTKS